MTELVPQQYKKFFIQCICANCNKLYFKRKKRSPGRTGRYNVRGVNTITCSKKCSSNYFKEFNKLRKRTVTLLERQTNNRKVYKPLMSLSINKNGTGRSRSHVIN